MEKEMTGTCPCGGHLKENSHLRKDGTEVTRTTCGSCGRTEVVFYKK
jgi:transcription elongation factor Elf1